MTIQLYLQTEINNVVQEGDISSDRCGLYKGKREKALDKLKKSYNLIFFLLKMEKIRKHDH